MNKHSYFPYLTTTPPDRATVLFARLFLVGSRLLTGVVVLGLGFGLVLLAANEVARRLDQRRRLEGPSSLLRGGAQVVHARGEVCFFVDGVFVDKAKVGARKNPGFPLEGRSGPGPSGPAAGDLVQP